MNEFGRFTPEEWRQVEEDQTPWVEGDALFTVLQLRGLQVGDHVRIHDQLYVVTSYKLNVGEYFGKILLRSPLPGHDIMWVDPKNIHKYISAWRIPAKELQHG